MMRNLISGKIARGSKTKDKMAPGHVLIFWQNQCFENASYEQEYALKFCKNFLKESLQKNSIPFVWTEDATHETLIRENDGTEAEYVLIIRDPLIIINGTVVKMMMQTIGQGFDACGPGMNITKNKDQTASQLFAVLSTSTFEELNQFYLEQNKRETEITTAPDESCMMYSWQYFKKYNKAIFKGITEDSEKNEKTARKAIIKNSFVFTFRSQDDISRSDLASLIPDKTMTLLDIGCSSGGLGKLLKASRPEINTEGVELNQTFAEQASRYYKKVHHCSIENFIANKYYDVVVCGDVLEHLYDPWEQLRRIHDFLNKGGCLIASVPNAGHWSFIYDQLKGKFEYIPWGITCITHIRWFTETSVKQAIHEAGFTIDLFNRQQLTPSFNGKKFIKKMTRLGYGDEQSLLTNGFIIRAVKK